MTSPKTNDQLKAFGKNPFQEKVSIKTYIQRVKTVLKIQFIVEDPDSLIAIPLKESFFQRTSGLWQYTCFECFFAEKNKKSYWELNLDHTGNWNLYHFDSYRHPQPPQEEKAVKQLELEFLKKPEGFELQCDLDLKDLNLEEKPLDVSLNCVIEWKSKEKSYYALAHCGDKPDFHLREAFVCNLE